MVRSTVVLIVCVVALGLLGCEKPGSQSTVSGQGGATLTIHKPADVVMTRGGMAEVKIVIDRQNVKDAVMIAFTGLPAGVSVIPADMKIVGDEGVYTLKAADDAQLMANDHVTITATALSGINASIEFILTLKEKT